MRTVDRETAFRLALLQRGGGEASIIFGGLENTCSQAYILVKYIAAKHKDQRSQLNDFNVFL